MLPSCSWLVAVCSQCTLINFTPDFLDDRYKSTLSKGKPLRLAELVAIALGGMVGGGIFSIMGISVFLIGYLT